MLVSITAAGQTAADLIIVNANIHTLDQRVPRAEAVAVLGGRFTAVGTNERIRGLAGTATHVIDAKGKLVIPGFNDAHVHFTGIGNQFSHLSLKEADDAADVLKRAARFTSVLPLGRWLLGAGLKVSAMPTREQLDAVSPVNPVLLYLADSTSALVNTAALKAANVTDTGPISGARLAAVRRSIPLDNATNWAEIAATASTYAASLGVTSVQDVHSDDLIQVYRSLAAAGRLKTRIYECIAIGDRKKLAAAGVKAAAGDAMVRGGCVKGMSHGVSEEMPELRNSIAEADKAGLQVMVHAIGAEANANTLDAFEYAIKQNGRRDRRFRAEHTHRLRDRDISRLPRSSVIASMQPNLFYSGPSQDGDNFQAMLRSGVRLAFGSDASMDELNPILGIYAAVNSGPRSISVEEAVIAYTLGSAYAEFQENEKGTITTGKLADLVILSVDIFAVEPSTIDKAKVVMTIVDGRVIYETG